MPLSREKKEAYFERMKELLGSYTKAFVVEVDNVGSKQLQNTRAGLRGSAEVLMGKNTMMRKIFKEFKEENPENPICDLADLCKGNVGFIFTNGDLGKIREVIDENVRPAPARVGAIAPSDVIVPKGPTGCDPGQTAFFQTLQIATKITKGQIEMTNDTHLITKGDKVGASQAALLQKLDINPFTYGLGLKMVYDNGSLFDAKVLDITDDVLAAKFGDALIMIANLSLVLNYPTPASVPHSIANAYKACLAITVQCAGFSFEKADLFKALIKPAAEPAAEE
ncbi:hypothetical protein TrCOL_g1518 [Triparma columacea]|jgi:large subunit ribosomal protein LP0|uniref:60S acidic ribosomal protein P0 n=1 Tax=Triparma columacea TaxID=722753 RepID=A0A9W7GFP7_9STRA|nr:hypothetical protein TrCOL_g1518 [Triparma columacea]